jgi:hypothetical protein
MLDEAVLHLKGEPVRCPLGSGPAALVGRSVWVFLADRRFATKAKLLSYWISLDFLGFSRPNRDFSIGCAGFVAKDFFRGLLRPVGCRQKWSARSERAKERDWSSGELNLISGFPQ